MIPHFQIELSIAGNPPIRRTVLVPEFLTLQTFGEVIAICFGWNPATPIAFTAASYSRAHKTKTNKALSESTLPPDTVAYHYFLDNSAPFYAQPAIKNAARILLEIQEFRLMRVDTTLQLLESCGNHPPIANGIHTLFSAEAVNQQLTSIQTALRKKRIPLPEQMLNEFPNFKEEFLHLLQVEANDDDTVSIPKDNAELQQLLQDLIDEAVKTMDNPVSLHDCLTHCTKEELMTFIRTYGITGCSKLRKAELVERLEQYLLDPVFFKSFCAALTYPELDVLGELCLQNLPPLPEVMQSSTYFANLGICYPTKKGFLTLPTEYRAALESYLLDIDFQHMVQLFDTVHFYCLLDVYLYGIYPVAKLLQQIEQLTGLLLTTEELEQLTYYRTQLNPEYFFDNGNIVHPLLENQPLQQADLLQQQQKNPVAYQPDDLQLERFYEEHWLIQQELYDQFEAKFFLYFQEDAESFNGFLHTLDLFMHTLTSFNDLVQLLCEAYFHLPDQQTTVQFIALLQKLWNNTIRWDLNGYTPLQKKTQRGKNNVIPLHAHRKKK